MSAPVSSAKRLSSSPPADPSRPWFESPFFERELEATELEQSEKDLLLEFRERGFVVVDLEIPDFDELARRLDAALEPEFAASPDRVKDAWRMVPEVKQLATHVKVLNLLRLLYRREPIPFQTLNFHRGTQQRTHSDLVHFNSMPSRFLAGVWVALEDVHPDSGPLHYYPGSHRLPVYGLDDLGMTAATQANRNDKYSSYEDFLDDLMSVSGLERETVTMDAGQALIWAGNLAHGGDPIGDPHGRATRRSPTSTSAAAATTPPSTPIRRLVATTGPG